MRPCFKKQAKARRRAKRRYWMTRRQMAKNQIKVTKPQFNAMSAALTDACNKAVAGLKKLMHAIGSIDLGKMVKP